MVKCDACGKEFKNEHGLRIHQSKMHKDTNNGSSDASHLTEPCKTEDPGIADVHNSDAKKLFKCTKCSRSFDTERGLKIHITKSHYIERKENQTKFSNQTPKLQGRKKTVDDNSRITSTSDVLNTNISNKFDWTDNWYNNQSASDSVSQVLTTLTDEPTPSALKTQTEVYKTNHACSRFDIDEGLKIHNAKSPGTKTRFSHPTPVLTVRKDNSENKCTTDAIKTSEGYKLDLADKENNTPSVDDSLSQFLQTISEEPPTNDDEQNAALNLLTYGRFVCNLCPLAFQTEQGKREHMKQHEPTKMKTESLSLPVQRIRLSKAEFLKMSNKRNIKFESKDDLTIIMDRKHKHIDLPVSRKLESIYREDNRPVSGKAARLVRKQTETNVLEREDTSKAAKEINTFVTAFITKLNAISPKFKWKPFTSGSYYDKTKNSQADEFDIMIYPADFQVKVDFGCSLPGFQKVKLERPRMENEIKSMVTDDGHIRPALFKKFVFDLFGNVLKPENHHEFTRIEKKVKDDDSSPAYTIKYQGSHGRIIDIDLVPCFRVEGWPPIAKIVNPAWVKDDKVVNEAIRFFDVVCKTCPDDIPEKDLLWRMSFSYTEKKLITCANNGSNFSMRKKVFKNIKDYIQKMKDRDPNRIRKFCSYHIKQFMLHQYDVWYEGAELVKLQRIVVEKLIKKLTRSPPYIENYFIENDNVLRYVPQEEIDLVVNGLREEVKALV